jgi:hypothetical protein
VPRLRRSAISRAQSQTWFRALSKISHAGALYHSIFVSWSRIRFGVKWFSQRRLAEGHEEIRERLVFMVATDFLFQAPCAAQQTSLIRLRDFRRSNASSDNLSIGKALMPKLTNQTILLNLRPRMSVP